MSVIEAEVKVRKVVVDPRISLTMMGRLVMASDKVKLSIIKKCKYQSEFVPGYHEMARKTICEAFENNIKGDFDIYFDEFKSKAKEFRHEANLYPIDKVAHKNPFYSAEGLDGVVAMEGLLTPLLDNYTFYSNLTQKKNSVMLNNVRIGSMADMLLFDQYGVDHIGFLKFNFSKSKYPAEEAAVKLQVLKRYFEGKQIELNPADCYLVDVPARRIYTLDEVPNATSALNKGTVLIRDNWDLI